MARHVSLLKPIFLFNTPGNVAGFSIFRGLASLPTKM
jgi:hypothetical protein